MASHNTRITLKEFCPLYYLYNNIPVKVHKGFRTVMVYLTALDTNKDFIALGSSIGMLYLYCRKLSQMSKYSLEGKMETITSVKLLSCFDDLVAVGGASGRVAVFQLASPLPGRNKQLRRFDVVGIHKTSVTALAWSANGMKLFSGDDKGKVVYSALDLIQGTCIPGVVLEEPSAIVQLEYSQKVLLVSTHQRSVLFYTEEKALQQMGTKPRKSSGKFGACFHPALCKQSDMLIYAARPGLRLWRVDIHGTVLDTYLLKDLFVREMPYFELLPHPSPTGGYRPPERQLGLVSSFMKEDWVLSWNEYSVYVLDCFNQVIIGSLEGCGDIVSVSCTESEIFILRGDRDILRISSRPEGLSSHLSDLPLHLSSPLSNSPVFLPPTGTVENAQAIRTLPVILEQKDGPEQVNKEQTEGKVISLEKVVLSEEAEPCGNEACRRSSSFTSVDSEQSLASTVEQSTSELSSASYSTITEEDFQKELVVKPIKVKKKARRIRHDSGNRLSEQSSWSDGNFSQETWSSEGTRTPGYEVESEHNSLLSSSVDLQDVESLDMESSVNEGSLCSDTFSLLVSPDSTYCPKYDSPMAMDAPGYPQMEASLSSQQSSGLHGVDNQRGTHSGNVNHDDSHSGVVSPDINSLLSCTFAYVKNSSSEEITEVQIKEAVESSSSQHIMDAEQEHAGNCAKTVEVSSADVPQQSYSDKQGDAVSSDEEDIYTHAVPRSSSGVSLVDVLHSSNQSSQGKNTGQEDPNYPKSDQLAESWMSYVGPGCGIFSLAVTDRYIWCLDMKGGLYCSGLHSDGLRWQKFEDCVQQMAVSPSGNLLWMVEQKTNKAFACGKVTIKGKRHWYEAQTNVAFVALSEDSAWIIQTNGDLFLQTGLSLDRPCARAVKVDCPCPLSQITARSSVVWALSDQRALLYRQGLNSYCAEGEQWKYDTVSESQGLEPVSVSLGDHQTVWALDAYGNLWFRTGITATKPRGDDNHWWQVSITDYVVYDQGSLFQTLVQATQSVATATKAPMERVADRLRVAFWSQQPQSQPNLISTNSSSIWIASGRNSFHVAKGNLIGTYWDTVIPRGTASATKWAFVISSAVPTKEGNFLWLGQSRKDLLCVWDQDGQLRPSTVQLPVETEMVHLSACRDAVWAMDGHGRIFIRTLSASCPTGLHWTLLDLSQLGHVRLVSFSCGSQNVWACDSNGTVYFRVGTQPLNPSMMLPAWICIEPPALPVGLHLRSVHTSPNDRMLWALDSRGSVHVRTGISEEMPVGTNWEHVPGLQATLLALSVRTVWVQCPSGEVARRYGITDKNPAGDYWKKIPGQVNWLSVTPMDELWAVGFSSALIHRRTKSFQHISSVNHKVGSMNGEELEDEWEVI